MKANLDEFVQKNPFPQFTNQYRVWAYIVQVYDGDSITILFESGVNNWQLWKTRLLDIDAPEVRGKEKPLGIATRNWLADKILAEWIPIDMPNYNLDKYGRLLITPYEVPDPEQPDSVINLSQEMIRLGLVKPYNLRTAKTDNTDDLTKRTFSTN